MANTKPIFLHGLWRSGSTYVWSRFRELPHTYCYYEPLNQGLHRLTLGRIGRDTPERTENNHHPQMAQPYFAEFAPLVFGRGVSLNKRAFAYDKYVLKAGQQHRALQSYIGSLLDHAANLDKQAVLGFNRTGLRIEWLRNKFDSYNIYIDRDPIDVWHSYEQQRHEGNNTFYTAWLETIERNQQHPLFVPLAKYIGVRKGAMRFLTRTKSYYTKLIERMSASKRYQMVAYLWLLCLLEGAKNCDVVIDMARADDKAYLEKLSATIGNLTGAAVDFSDIKFIAQKPEPLLPEHKALEGETFSLLPRSLLSTPSQNFVAELSPRKQALVKAALQLS